MHATAHRAALLTAALAVTLTFAGTAGAQTYPTRSIRMVVPFAPGGTADIIGRPLAQRLSEQFGQTVVIDNRGGAGGAVGADLVAKAAPDGYTLLLGSSGALTISPNFGNIPYDPIRDFTPIGLAATSQFILVVHPSVPATSVKQLIALAGAKAGALRYGSAGTGNVGHLAGELFDSLARVQMTHVPYKGAAPMTTDLLAGRVELAFPGLASLVPQVKSGKLRALAVTGPKRSDVLPDVPTLHESGLPGYEAITFWGLLAPGKTARPIIERLSTALNAALKTPELRNSYISTGNDPASSTPEEFATLIKGDIGKWGKLIKDANIKPDD
jgi:tripartite-type tricarboxylate transporter receptor subunit TctC